MSGTTNVFFVVKGWDLDEGSIFSEQELKAEKSVCLLGATVKKELFGQEFPLGKSIRIGKISFKVIGTFHKKGQSGFRTDQDDIVVVPIKTLQRRMVGNTDVRTILVSTSDGISTTAVKTAIEGVLRDRRSIGPDQDDDFHVRDMTEIIDTIIGTTTVLTALLSAVAGVSLLVGGIGIMNIMLVSVTERTKEIGTRLAIGALERDVLLQFLVESVALSSLGGLLGIALGLGGAALCANLIGVPFVLRPGIVAIAFLFSGAVGMIFGFVRARKAAQMDPIEALRYE